MIPVILYVSYVCYHYGVVSRSRRYGGRTIRISNFNARFVYPRTHPWPLLLIGVLGLLKGFFWSPKIKWTNTRTERYALKNSRKELGFSWAPWLLLIHRDETPYGPVEKCHITTKVAGRFWHPFFSYTWENVVWTLLLIFFLKNRRGLEEWFCWMNNLAISRHVESLGGGFLKIVQI